MSENIENQSEQLKSDERSSNKNWDLNKVFNNLKNNFLKLSGDNEINGVNSKNEFNPGDKTIYSTTITNLDGNMIVADDVEVPANDLYIRNNIEELGVSIDLSTKGGRDQLRKIASGGDPKKVDYAKKLMKDCGINNDPEADASDGQEYEKRVLSILKVFSDKKRYKDKTILSLAYPADPKLENRNLLMEKLAKEELNIRNSELSSR